MKCFYILDNNNNQVYSLVYAKTAKSALKKYLKGMMTMGFYEIVKEDGEVLKGRRKLSKEEIRRKVFNAARILDLGQYLDRRPKELSGGQMQRVA